MSKLLAVLFCFVVVSCSKVPAGNVGVKVYLLGGDKGVDSEELTPGRYWIGINEDLFLFPTFSQNYVWQRQGGIDESLTFGTSEGLSVNADIGITYAIDPTKVNTVFQKYRRGVEEITDVYLRNMVRDALVKASSTRRIEDVYGVGKAGLIAEVEAAVRAEVSAVGIMVEKVYWIGDLRLPDRVTDSINAKITATQQSQQRENEVATARAQADIDVTKAEGEARAKLAIARAEAEAINLRGAALRDNPSLIDLTIAERWDGKLPTTNGGAIPLLNIK